MQVIDYLLLAAVVISVVIGVIRGFFREALSLVTWITAIWIGWEYGTVVEPILGGVLAQGEVKLWAGRFLLFLGILLLGSVAGWAVTKVVQSTGLSGADRVLGMGFGLGRGVLIVGLLVLLGQVLELEGESWWQQSKFVPYGARVADSIKDFLEGGMDLGTEPAKEGAAQAT